MTTDQPPDTPTEWEGYSDYRRVSDRLARNIDEAVELYAEINGRHAEGAPVDKTLAAEARAKILAAAMKLTHQLEQDRDTNDTYDQILTDWQQTDNGDPGYIARLNKTSLQNKCPGWLFDFVRQLRVAGWELGYVQAGRTSKVEPDDPAEAQSEAMLK